MGVCSIEGGNAGGIPDRQQRSRTFRQFTVEPYHNRVLQNTLIRPSMCRNKPKPELKAPLWLPRTRVSDKSDNR